MMETGIEQSVTKPPPRDELSKWVRDSLESLPMQLVKNAWRHAPYSYFPDENEEALEAGGTLDDEEPMDDDPTDMMLEM